jgi:hypothetical protein
LDPNWVDYVDVPLMILYRELAGRDNVDDLALLVCGIGGNSSRRARPVDNVANALLPGRG